MSNISQAVYDRYNLYYNNTSYRAFQRALDYAATVQASLEGPGAILVIDTCNLLTDAALARCGAECYATAESTLLQQLRRFDNYLTALALRHLANFGPAPQTSPSFQTPHQPDARQFLGELQTGLLGYAHDAQAEYDAHRKSAGLFAEAAALMLGAAVGLLVEGDGYSIEARVSEEKVRHALLALGESIQGNEALRAAQSSEFAIALGALLDVVRAERRLKVDH